MTGCQAPIKYRISFPISGAAYLVMKYVAVLMIISSIVSQNLRDFQMGDGIVPL